MKHIKTYLEINESRNRITAIELVTRHRGQVEDFIAGLNDLVADQVRFCQNPELESNRVTQSLDSLITDMADQNGLDKDATVGELARLFETGLVDSIVNLARVKTKKLAKGEGLKISQEVVAAIGAHMKEEYDENGIAIMQAIMDIFQSLQIQVEPFCNTENTD